MHLHYTLCVSLHNFLSVACVWTIITNELIKITFTNEVHNDKYMYIIYLVT